MELFPRSRTTPLPGGYMGKVLRVDLTSGQFRDENLPEEPVLRKFIGGQALALYILLRELPLNATPFGPENTVVLMTGPLTGNGFTPGGTKMTAVYLSPLTEKTLGRGATSGYWGTYLKAAGYDGIIVSGAAAKPVYLYIHDGKAELRDAAAVWGLGTRATDDRLRDHESRRASFVYRAGGRTSQSCRDARQRLQPFCRAQRRGRVRLQKTQSDCRARRAATELSR